MTLDKLVGGTVTISFRSDGDDIMEEFLSTVHVFIQDWSKKMQITHFQITSHDHRDFEEVFNVSEEKNST